MIRRRDFLALVAAGAAACKRSSTSVATTTSTSASASIAPLPTTRILPVFEAKIIDAVAARVLPSDEAPGAREVNALQFIDGQLAEGDLAPLANGVIAAARILDAEAKRRHARAFVDLDPSLQDALLADFSEAKLAVAFPQREAFRLLHMLTLEAFLSDPIHGGNNAMVGWRWIRFPTPTLRFPGDPHSHHP